MKKYTITHNGFHGRQTHAVMGEMIPQNGGVMVRISESGARRFSCRMADCSCGEGLPTEFWVPAERVSGREIAVEGSYPQRW